MFQQSRLIYLLITAVVLLIFYLSGPFASAKATPIKRFSNADARLARWVEVMSPPRRSFPAQHFYDHPMIPAARDQSQPLVHIHPYPLGKTQMNRAQYLENRRKSKEVAPKVKAPAPPKAVKAPVEEEIPDGFDEEVVRGSNRAAAASKPFQAQEQAVDGQDAGQVISDEVAPTEEELVVIPRIDDYSAPFIRLIPPNSLDPDQIGDAEEAAAIVEASPPFMDDAGTGPDDRTILDLDTTAAAAADEALKSYPDHAPKAPAGVRAPIAVDVTVDARAPAEAKVGPIGEAPAAIKAAAPPRAPFAVKAAAPPDAAPALKEAAVAKAPLLTPAAADERDSAADHPDAVRNPLAAKIPVRGKIGQAPSPAEIKGGPLIREPYTEVTPDLPWATLDTGPAQVIENQVLPKAAVAAPVVPRPVGGADVVQAAYARKNARFEGVSEEDV